MPEEHLTETEYVAVYYDAKNEAEGFLQRYYPNIKYEVEYHEHKVYFKFKNKSTAKRMQKILRKEGYLP